MRRALSILGRAALALPVARLPGEPEPIRESVTLRVRR